MVVAASFTFFNREQAEYIADAYLEDPEVLRADVNEADGAWRVVVTRR